MNSGAKSKILNLGLVLTSLLGYLEWGGDNRSFLFQIEVELLGKLVNEPSSVLHPLTLLPLIGQLLLIIALFRKSQSKMLTYTGLGGIVILMFFIFLSGMLSLNYKVILSTLPFIFIGILTIRHYRRRKNPV